MEQTVYGDLFFLINFSMDFLCLFLVAKLLSRPMCVWRFVLASVLGGVYSVAGLFILPQGVAGTILDVLCCALLCAVALIGRGDSPISLLLVTVSYFVSSALLGGIMTAVFSLLNRLSPMPSTFGESTEIPLPILIPVGVLSGLATLLGGRFLKRRAQTQTVGLDVRLCGRQVVCRAFCDSGNLLCDPLDGRLVILLDNRLARRLLPAEYEEPEHWTYNDVNSLPDILAGRVRAIPVNTANAESVLFAFRPDRVVVKKANRSHPVDALVGFADLGGAPCDCQALIPPGLLT